jgi:methionyl aminopeptidase
MISRNDPCWCQSGKRWKHCHYPQTAPHESALQVKKTYLQQYGIRLKSPKEIEGIRQACQITARILHQLCLAAQPGVSTEELDQLSIQLHHQHRVKPAPLGYGSPPYPKTICTSLNEVVCHGIPSPDDILKEGDILNIDVSCITDEGFFGDASRMVMVGTVSEDKRRVVQASKEALAAAITVCQPQAPLSAIGDAIEMVTSVYHCSVVYQFVGHGVGLFFHEPPDIFHHKNDYHLPMVPGMTFTIEPMINLGVPDAVIDPNNRWVATTVDKLPSAQWEHTILITETGHEILTLYV